MPAAKIGKQQGFILFTLGMLYDELNRKLEKKHLQIAVPKYIFIELIHKAQITEKGTRAIYRNLEALEDKKYILYKNRNLSLTEKGQKMYRRIQAEHEPYIRLTDILSKVDLLKYSRKSQTVFRFD